MAKRQTKVLIVEDEGLIALDTRNKLEDLGYSVVGIASSIDKALEKIERSRPDIVLLDIRLDHNSDGIKIAEHIRMHFKIPFIYMTAYADEATLEEAKRTVPYGYILKPFEDEEAHTLIQIALYKHKIDAGIREKTLNSVAEIKEGAESILQEGDQRHDDETIQRVKLIADAASKICEAIGNL